MSMEKRALIGAAMRGFRNAKKNKVPKSKAIKESATSVRGKLDDVSQMVQKTQMSAAGYPKTKKNFVKGMAERGRLVEKRLQNKGLNRTAKAVKDARTQVSRKIVDYEKKRNSPMHKFRKAVGTATLATAAPAYAVSKLDRDPEKQLIKLGGDMNAFWQGFEKQASGRAQAIMGGMFGSSAPKAPPPPPAPKQDTSGGLGGMIGRGLTALRGG